MTRKRDSFPPPIQEAILEGGRDPQEVVSMMFRIRRVIGGLVRALDVLALIDLASETDRKPEELARTLL